MSRRHILVAAAITAVAAVPAAGALGAGANDTTVTIEPTTVLKAPATSPFDAPGTPAVRKGKAIPAGYRLIGRKITIQRGSQAGWGALRMTCPSGTKTRTLARTGDIGPQLVGKYHSTFVVTLATNGPDVKPGQSVSGTVWLVCR
jgi:hypothetical protein